MNLSRMKLRTIIQVLFLLGAYVVGEVLGDCTNFPIVEHSTNNGTHAASYPEGYAVHFTCDLHYRGQGIVSYTCTAGNFIGNYQCVLITCPYVAPPRNGRIDGSPTYEVATEITFKCDEGYVLVGQESRLCRVDGQWSSETPECKVVNCGDFSAVSNGRVFQVNLDGVMNGYGSYVKVECFEGYVLSGLTRVKCQSNGLWEVKPECKQVNCPPYPGVNSSCVFNTLLNGGMYYLACRSDVSVTKVGGDAASCENDGTWSTLDLACYCDCPMEDDYTSMGISASNVNDQGYIKHLSKLEWSCDGMFDSKSSDVDIICEDGVLSGKAACILSGWKVFLFIIFPILIGIAVLVSVGFFIWKKHTSQKNSDVELPLDDTINDKPIYKKRANGADSEEERNKMISKS